jgi:hypothetical protein
VRGALGGNEIRKIHNAFVLDGKIEIINIRI